MDRENTNYELDWGSIIVDIVKKKDLDTGNFADCWEENYDWTKLDSYVINNYEQDLVDYALTKIDCENINFPPFEENIKEDLKNYYNEINNN